jgi:hypothetical protein
MIYKTKYKGGGTDTRKVFMGDGKERRKLYHKTTPLVETSPVIIKRPTTAKYGHSLP